MDRVQKTQWVEDFSASFSGAQIVILVHYKGLNVAQMSELRSKVRHCGASFKVTKNSLAKLAVEGTEFDGLKDQFVGPTAVAFSDDSVAAAKVLSEFSENNEKLVILGASFGGVLMSQKEVQELAKLPSLDQLRAKIVSLINAPATRIAGVTGAPAGKLARVFGAYGGSQ